MCAEYSLRFELPDKPSDPNAGVTWKPPSQSRESRGQFQVICFGENQTPKFRGVFDKLYITIRMDLAVQRGKELHQVELLYDIRWIQRPPSFFQGRRSGKVSAASSRSSSEYANG